MSVRARLAAILAFAFALSLVPASAQAATLTKNDADDSDGLDLAAVTLTTRPRNLLVKMRTYDAFANAALRPKNGALGLAFKIDRNTVRAIGIGTNADGELRARICSAPTGSGSVDACSRLAVRRLDETSIRITIPKAKLKRGITTYIWSAIAYDTCGANGPCVDSVPDSRFARWTP